MIPWENLERAKAPGGAELSLHRRGDEYVIRVDGHDLMSNRMHGSEESLAGLGCADLRARPDARVLIGGLGMGYTLRATLDLLGPQAKVDVAELVPAVIAWNRGVLAPLAGSPLDDPRTRVEAMDVALAIADARDHYDAILLDVDNGPDALTSPSNARLYGLNGLMRIRGALRKGGVLAVWSVADDVRFTARMARAGYEVRIERVLARHNAKRPRGKRHVIWIARRRD